MENKDKEKKNQQGLKSNDDLQILGNHVIQTRESILKLWEVTIELQKELYSSRLKMLRIVTLSLLVNLVLWTIMLITVLYYLK